MDQCDQLRATFHNRYAIKRSTLAYRNNWPRLVECILCIAKDGDPDYFQPGAEREFEVVDLRTREKAWLEIPLGAAPEVLQGMIESHFACRAHRVSEWLWVV
ncbi:MAG: hypothetical protein V4731_15015 [Pseudomonadota bacterium]